MLERKTKIICTIGPSSFEIDKLTHLIESGMDAARLNFSHGSHELHKQYINNIRTASKKTGKEIAIIQDLQGPKIRIGKVENGSVLLVEDHKFTITIDDIPIGSSEIVSTSYKNLVNEVKAGNTILLDDGYIILNVEKVTKNNIETIVVKGGYLKDNKGIIAPGVSSSAPSLSEKDIEDLKFGLENGIDAVALSFVRSERDVIELKTIMKLFKKTVPIIAKIERYEGVEDIKDIIHESDAIMVARGDLGLEMPPEQVPVLQKDIIKHCNFHGKPVIIATQMLESMIENPRPTRAEASDVANAVIDGADCVMLSGETSIGKYPIEAVTYMHKIILATESKYHKIIEEYENTNYISDALGRASCVISKQINAKAIVALTSSGYTPLNIAKYRPQEKIIVLTDNVGVQRVMNSLVWGCNAYLIPEQFPENDINKLTEYLKEIGNFSPDDLLVLVAGLSASRFLNENIIKVIKIE